MSPLAWRHVYADLAFIFHWSPRDLDDLEWTEIIAFHGEAISRWNAVHAPRKQGHET